ncbi:mercuric transporter MerT family protein (plasmid) [Pararoseomonas sp. SCSIO 73927]|uniref:mercuric transporter MerT family protein n=1 Tax=Pararoseomonas sp. SCSIO 73927 TaxID=3114537 RepID=UPI0030D21841
MPDIPAAASSAAPPSGTAPVLLTLGGLLAAFGAASCCALPMLLGSLGLGSAWLFGLALLVVPYRIVLLAAAAACLAGSAILLWHQRRAVTVTCESGAACPSNPALRHVTAGGLAIGILLLVISYAYA